jgi:hypothetical protein
MVAETKKIKASEIIKDIGSGMDNAQLMEKYGITAAALRDVLRRLIEAGLLKRRDLLAAKPAPSEPAREETEEVPDAPFQPVPVADDVHAGSSDSPSASPSPDEKPPSLIEPDGEAPSATEEPATTPDLAIQPSPSAKEEPAELPKLKTPQPSKYFPVMEMAIYELDDLSTEYTVEYFTEKGIKVKGLDARVGEKKSFMVQPDEFADVFPFVFEGICRWVDTDPDKERPTAGFDITSISKTGFDELSKLIRAATIPEGEV